MAFILYRDLPDDSIKAFQSRWKAYRNYLESVSDRLPKSAYEFAAAECHYNFSDPKALHDGWLEELIVREQAFGERRQHRSLEIFVRLLAAYHDGYIELTYKGVQSYSLSKPINSLPNHRDWLNDEIRLSENGLVLHEIEWESGEWEIECEDVFYEWKALE